MTGPELHQQAPERDFGGPAEILGLVAQLERDLSAWHRRNRSVVLSEALVGEGRPMALPYGA